MEAQEREEATVFPKVCPCSGAFVGGTNAFPVLHISSQFWALTGSPSLASSHAGPEGRARCRSTEAAARWENSSPS